MFSARLRKLSEGVSNVLRLSRFSADERAKVKKLLLIKTFDRTVDPFSKIYIESPMHVRIAPLDPLERPDGDRLSVSLYGRETDGSSKISIKRTANRIDVVGDGVDSESEAVCVVSAPVTASFEVKALGKSSISVDGMHSDSCHLKTVSGSIRTKNVRGRNVTIRTESGPVFCEGTLQAEKIDILTESTEGVACQHIRANVLKITTRGGNVSCDSCYADETHVTTVLGCVRLANLHGNCNVEILEMGDLSMTGFEGNINAILKRGNIYLQASRLAGKNSVFLHESGMADVRISSELRCLNSIEIIAGKLNIEDEISNCGNILDDRQQKIFKYENSISDELSQDSDELSNELHVECRNGSVKLKSSSWKKDLEDMLNKPSS